MINVNGLKRNAKNIVKKYSDAQVKVREATSNDPWGPSSTITAEIADLTYNVVAFSEIMSMLWKRLNDHGRNWRHVYKALVVLDYLVKTGSEKVAQQCIDNIFKIQTLKDFQYIEENKDLGMNIREKSKKLVALLKDPEKLQAERARAIKAKSRGSESVSYDLVGKHSLGSLTSSGSSSGDNTVTSSSNNNGNSFSNFPNDSGSSSSGNVPLPELGSLAILGYDLDAARPQTVTEEENQLKLALALSKQEAEKQEKTKKNDELRLKLALDVSKKSGNSTAGTANLLDDSFPTSSTSSLMSKQSQVMKGNASFSSASSSYQAPTSSTIDDLLGLTIPPVEVKPVKPISSIAQNDPWSVGTSSAAISSLSSSVPVDDPWNPLPAKLSNPTTNSNLDKLNNFDNDLATLMPASFPKLTEANGGQSFDCVSSSTRQPSNANDNELTLPNSSQTKRPSKNPFEDNF